MTEAATLNLYAPDSAVPNAIATRRVLHVINGKHYSGAERVQDLLALELPQVGFEVGFACLKPDRFPLARQSQETTLTNTPMRWRFDARCVQELVQLIHLEDYKLIHAHTPRSVWIGCLASQRANVPLIYHVHSPTARDSTRRIQNWVNAWLERWSIRDVSRLIAVSPSLKQMMQGQGFADERVTYVPNGVPSQTTTERHRPDGTWTLGIAALFRPRKGVEILLEALAMLRSRGVDVQLRAVGPFETPEYETEVRGLVDRLGIGQSITWTGFVGDVPAELRQMDLMVLPSLFGEGLPMVILEAMAAGVPVVASHVEGVPEAIIHRENGLLVEPASVSQLASAIEEIIHGVDIDYTQLSENATQRHAEQFSAQAMAAGVAQVYREVLGDV
jgi:glycosyltransferase involved in cell wall biosynthesis